MDRWERVASARASSRSKLSTRSRFSRVSKERSRSAISSSPKPERVRSISGIAWRSASSRARRASSKEPPILLSARLSRRACSIDRSRKQTGTVVRPRRRAATNRWWPPMTTPSSRRANTGWTKPNCRMERSRESSSSSLIRRGLAGSGWSESIGTCSIVRVELGTAFMRRAPPPRPSAASRPSGHQRRLPPRCEHGRQRHGRWRG